MTTVHSRSRLHPVEWSTLVDRYAEKATALCSDASTLFPHITQFGKWRTTADGYWTGGFWVGQLWWLWKLTGRRAFRSAADKYQKRLAPRLNADEVNFDLGFLFAYSYALGYELTGTRDYRETALAAADRLLELAHPKSGLLYHIYPKRVQQHGGHTATSIIDVMMNLTLLWWAWKETNRQTYLEAADCHTRRSARWMVRDDGSTVQVIDFDARTGEMLRRDTHQGLSADSCWSRGQAWAIYGFLQAYHYTGEMEFLHVFRRLLDYWIDHVPDDRVPYWDFDAPTSSWHVRDSSAAAIVCAALARAKHWGIAINEAANQLDLETVASLKEKYLAHSSDSILAESCFHYPAGQGVRESTIWGDYYFLEAASSQV